jgi:hypothetical protein
MNQTASNALIIGAKLIGSKANYLEMGKEIQFRLHHNQLYIK